MTPEEIKALKEQQEALMREIAILKAGQGSPKSERQQEAESPLALHFKQMPLLDLSRLRTEDNADFLDALSKELNAHLSVISHRALEASHIQAKEHFKEFYDHITPELTHARTYGEEQFFGSVYKEYDGLADYDQEFRSYLKANSDDETAKGLNKNPELLRKYYADGFVKSNPKLAAAGLALKKAEQKEADSSRASGYQGQQSSGNRPNNQRPAVTATSGTGTGESQPASAEKAHISLFS
jgi:hypothetical protein